MGCTGAPTLVNSFSLVAYIPEPLASFLDRLRGDVQLGCTARSHVTLLPPRPIDYPLEQAASEIVTVIGEEYSFDISLGKITMFPASRVVYLSIGEGAIKLIQLHRLLNRGCCNHSEMFYYHPHVTLAQGLPPEAVDQAYETAKRRWDEYRGNRTFQLDRLTLVQNTIENEWQNLKEFTLKTPTMALR